MTSSKVEDLIEQNGRKICNWVLFRKFLNRKLQLPMNSHNNSGITRPQMEIVWNKIK